MNTHKHYKTAYYAYTNTSFSPEKRAESECAFFDEIMLEISTMENAEEKQSRFERLFLASLAAKSRCASPMITGPARFPVERNRKANESERKRRDEMFSYIEKLRKPSKGDSGIISSDDKDAIAKLQEKLEKLETSQALMVQFNKLVRQKKTAEEIQAAIPRMTIEQVQEIMQPDYMGRVGFASYALTNNNANIKTVRDRIKDLESKKELVTKEVNWNGVKVVQNAEENRIQLFFEGKPEADKISQLKRNGFKWSPTRGCWQRQNNNAGIYAAKQVCKASA